MAMAWNCLEEYIANGNIMTLRRYADNSAVMDSLTYNYTSNTNRLAYVDDVVAGGSFSVDVDDQAAANYTYDAIGNLTSDNAESIDAIYWNVYGKIDSIKRDAASNKQHLWFRYGPDGNRIMKKSVEEGESDTAYTYYVRDEIGRAHV